MRPSIQLLGVLLAGSLGAIASRCSHHNSCSHNNCLRAIIADAFPSIDGRGDCSAYLHITVTPSVSTFMHTVTVPTLVVVSSTVIEEETEVETVVASTETDYSEETATVPETLIVTETATATLTVHSINIAKRNDAPATWGTEYPAYAFHCTDLPEYKSACSCVGVLPSTTTLPAASATVTVVDLVSTSTSTDVSTTSTTTTTTLPVTDTTLVTSTVTVTTADETTTTTTTATTIATDIVRNGRFNNGLNSWTITGDSQISASVVLSTTDTNNFVLRTNNMFNNNLFEMRQQLTGVAGTTYHCRYDWIFTNHYETKYTDGNTYVPYVHIYINNDLFDNSTPQPPRSPGVWYTTEFQFTSSGSDTLWFDCASPQARNGASGGSNFLSLDNIACISVGV